jgi:hypothetical protein
MLSIVTQFVLPLWQAVFFFAFFLTMCVISVPSFGPMGVEANATSSTTIVVKWGDEPREHQNGQIEGFKVYYGSNPRLPFQVCSLFI